MSLRLSDVKYLELVEDLSLFILILRVTVPYKPKLFQYR